MSITTEERKGEKPMTMKNPPHPGACRVARMRRAVGLDDHGRRRRPRRDAQHAFGTRQREARHIAGNGREAVQGFRRHRARLACATGAVRPCTSPARPDEVETAGTGLINDDYARMAKGARPIGAGSSGTRCRCVVSEQEKGDDEIKAAHRKANDALPGACRLTLCHAVTCGKMFVAEDGEMSWATR